MKTGEPILRRGERQKRATNQPTPCRTCPKGSPERGEKLKITPENAQTIRLYVRNRAACGCLNAAEKEDAWLLRNLGIIDNVIRQYEAAESTIALSIAIEKFAEPRP